MTTAWDRFERDIDDLLALTDAFLSNFRMHPNPNPQMTNSSRGMFTQGPHGDFVRDYDRLHPDDDEDLRAVLQPAAERIRNAMGRPLPWTTPQFMADQEVIEVELKKARRAMTGRNSAVESIDRVISDFRKDYLLSLAVTLTGQGLVVQKVREWYRAGAGVPEDAYLDLPSFMIVNEDGPGRIAMRDVDKAASGGFTTFKVGEGIVESDRFPELQSMLYGQWFTYIYSLWEEHYRGRLAAAHGIAPDGKPWNRRDVKCPLFGDIRRIRNDFVHNKGVVDESSGNEILDWFTEGEEAKITVPQMVSLIELFPDDALRAQPERAEPGNPKQFPWPVDPDLLDELHERIRQLQLPKRRKRNIGNEALRLWLAAHPLDQPE